MYNRSKTGGIAWPGMKYMKNCFINNSDGAGVAWADADGLHIKKGYFEWPSLWQDLKTLEAYPVLLHCRFATHGSINEANCHPFLLKNGLAIAHNGIISIKPLEPDMTDSESFGKKCIEPFTVEELLTQRMVDTLETAIGSSKIVMLHGSGVFIILNGQMGEEFGGVWFSNDGYRGQIYYGLSPAYRRAIGKETNARKKDKAIAIEDLDDWRELYMRGWDFPDIDFDYNSDPFFANDRFPPKEKQAPPAWKERA
ncbi:hypothetical protein FACS1894110_01960 [Spirochaetia bacterium]|nr:hypothetical protein FACS1894110_01960 [Spirochaetia bacterium]